MRSRAQSTSTKWILRWRALSLLAGIVGSAAASAVCLAQDYPSQRVTMVVPTGPGGGMEMMARLFASQLEKRLGKPFVIENRAGAGGVIGSNSVAHAAPDGYTLLVANSTNLAINVTLYKSLPYDPANDFAPIFLHALSPFVLVVNPSVPVHSAAEFVAYARGRPGELSFGSAGPGTAHHLFAEMFNHQTGIRATHVPYKSTMQPLNDVVAGHLQYMFTDLPPSEGLIRDGRLRALGVSSKKRLAAAPEIPPLNEAGVVGFEAMSWHMIAAPAGTPPEVIEKLHTEIKAIAAMPEVKAQFAKIGLIAVDSPKPGELRKFVRSEIERWRAIVEQAGAAHSQ